MISRPAVEQNAAFVDSRRLALNPKKAVGNKVNHKVVGMTLTERNENGEISFHQCGEDLRFGRIPLESGGHGLRLRLHPDRTYVRPVIASCEVLKLARTRP